LQQQARIHIHGLRLLIAVNQDSRKLCE
jgi:hypothetical protein